MAPVAPLPFSLADRDIQVISLLSNLCAHHDSKYISLCAQQLHQAMATGPDWVRVDLFLWEDASFEKKNMKGDNRLI